MDFQLTKIVATISDRTSSPEFISKLYAAGLDVVRLNTAHQDLDGARKVIKDTCKVSNRIAILIDTKGPEIRCSKVDGEITVSKGDVIQIRSDNFDALTTREVIQVSYPKFVSALKVGQLILIDDGALGLLVTKKTKDALICMVQNDGVIKSKKSVNVPNVSIDLPTLTKKDIDFIQFGIENDVDFIAHSFVRNAEDIKAVRDILNSKKSSIKIIAKIENREGVQNLEDIANAADGIMVARGDLGIEIPLEQVPLIQKKIIETCRAKGKLVITATQMLQSMIENPRPTRAEVSDVANAILDGTDAIMLSGETASGKYPVECVETMARIAREIENNTPSILKTRHTEWPDKLTRFICKSAVIATGELPVKGIVILTKTGNTARLVSSYRGRVPIFAKCFDERVMRHLALAHGVHASPLNDAKTQDELLSNALCSLVEEKMLKLEDEVIVIGGTKEQKIGINFLEVKKVKAICNSK